MNWIPQDIEQYCIDHSSTPSALAEELEAHTRTSVHGSQMLVGKMEASFITFLMKLGRVKHVVELGTFTGYSALVMAEQLPEDGTLVTIDINPQTTALARDFWDRSPHGKKIRQILKPGMEALKSLEGTYDLIFIDADKNGYPAYLKWALEHLSERGFIISDNTIWKGKVLQPGLDKQTDSIRLHNDLAASLEGYRKTLLPIRDGMFLIQKD
jgi:caffeoyl-CoA O-methyltransferase